MSSIATRAVAYNVGLMEEDLAAKGWLRKDLAKRARVSAMAVTRFLAGERQTAPMGKKLARALGHDIERYLIRQSSQAVA